MVTFGTLILNLLLAHVLLQREYGS